MAKILKPVKVFIAGVDVSRCVTAVTVGYTASKSAETTVAFADDVRVEHVDGQRVVHILEEAKAVPEEPIFKAGDKVRLTPKHYLYKEGLNNNAVIEQINEYGVGHARTERKVAGSGDYGTHFTTETGEIALREELAVGDRVRIKSREHRFVATDRFSTRRGTVTEIVAEDDGSTHPRVAVDGCEDRYNWHFGNDDVEAI